MKHGKTPWNIQGFGVLQPEESAVLGGCVVSDMVVFRLKLLLMAVVQVTDASFIQRRKIIATRAFGEIGRRIRWKVVQKLHLVRSYQHLVGSARKRAYHVRIFSV
jgi:hypothetical protein